MTESEKLIMEDLKLQVQELSFDYHELQNYAKQLKKMSLNVIAERNKIKLDKRVLMEITKITDSELKILVDEHIGKVALAEHISLYGKNSDIERLKEENNV